MSKKNTVTEINQPQAQEDIIIKDLSDHAEQSYLEYAMSVVKGRAIPFVQDGLKPVQRRILYSMKELHLPHTAKPKKSARVVGDVIGKYHPHGDGAVYDAMVRTAQPFSLRYPLVIGDGNFGSRDGDGAAAMRYTEARLSAFSDTFLNELGLGTVDWKINYDNTMEEPFVLPARLPNLLLNGASGIGVGIATEIPSHNLNETVDAAIAMIKNPQLTLDEAMAFIPGPDYPTGGQIISSKEDIRKAYAEGRGSIRVRARYTIENEGSKNWRLVFFELPYPTSCQKIMEEVDALFNPKPKEKKDKKIFTPEQLRLKTLFSNSIEKFTDASDKDHPARLVFEPKNFKQDPQELIQILLAYTSLEMNCPVNMVAVGLNHTPTQKTLIQILSEWTEFRTTTVHRRTQYEYDQASKRLHILQGRLTILDHIEEVVRILKNSDEPKEALMTRFGLSEIQAEDVMEIRLRQLARLERTKITDEITKLETEIKRLQKLLESKTALKNQVIKELEADKKIFGDARRTLIEASEKTAVKAIEEQSFNEEPVTVAISERGWIRAKTGHQHDSSAFAFKSGDQVKSLFKASTSDYVIFIDESGKSYSHPVRELPLSKGGTDVPVSTLAEFSSKIAHSFVCNTQQKVILASDAGFGFIIKSSDLISRMKAGKVIMTQLDGAKILDPIVFEPSLDLAQVLFTTLSSNGRLLAYRANEINEMSKGKGLALCGLDDQATVSQIALWKDNVISFQIDGLKKPQTISHDQLSGWVQHRSSSKKGKPLDSKKRAVHLLLSESSSTDESN